MATSGMLTGGPALEYFKLLAPNPNNTMIFVNYQIEGTLGRSILKGLKEIPLANSAGKMDVIQVRMSVKSIDGFSGHSDRKQLLKFVNNISPRPKQVIIVHGEESKCIGMADSIRRFFHVDAMAPNIGDRMRVK